jgi:hypothetical protein
MEGVTFGNAVDGKGGNLVATRVSQLTSFTAQEAAAYVPVVFDSVVAATFQKGELRMPGFFVCLPEVGDESFIGPRFTRRRATSPFRMRLFLEHTDDSAWVRDANGVIIDYNYDYQFDAFLVDLAYARLQHEGLTYESVQELVHHTLVQLIATAVD